MTTDQGARTMTAPGSELSTYDPPAVEQYQTGLIMDAVAAKALDDQLRQATRAVLRENTDYGIIPGTGGDKVLFRPGAQKLLQWFGLSCTCDRVDIERDDEGRKHGITYRAVVTRRLPDGSQAVLATCEGTADYDESKFYQSAEDVQRKAETAERKFAEKDKRPPRPTRWQGLPEYRAPWNTLMKRAQKRAIVGAVIDATAAGGLFSQDQEEDDHSPAPQDDGPSWYEKALEQALTSTGIEAGGELQTLFAVAAQAHRDGLISRRQQDHLQNTIRQRVEKLKTVTVVDFEDVARAAHDDAEASQDDPRERTEDQPGTVSAAQLTKLHTVFSKLGFSGDDRDQKLVIAETIAGRVPLDGPEPGRSSKNLSVTEARKLIDTLEGFEDRDALVAYMAEHVTVPQEAQR